MKRSTLILLTAATVLLSGCGIKQTDVADKANEESGIGEENTEEENKYIREKTVIIINIDYENTITTVQNTEDGLRYELTYTGGCDIRDKYGEIISISQISPGQAVKIAYDTKTNKLEAIHFSPEAVTYENVRDFHINIKDNTITLSGEELKYKKNIVILSDKEEIPVTDINEMDELFITGINGTAYSIVITKGHGYIALDQEEYFDGGWIEIGRDIVRVLQADKEYCVTEGMYEVTISKNGYGGSKSVTVNRDETVTVDVGNLIGEEIKYGSVKFEIFPEEATLLIDHKVTDYRELVSLSYGIHSITVKASGYETVNNLLKVGENLATIEINLTSQNDSPEEQEDTQKAAGTVEEEQSSDATDSGEDKEDVSESTTELIDEVLNQLIN